MNNPTGAYESTHMPLAGAILCFTSVPPEQRTELGVIGAQMGAQVKLDLTSDVTHLIVGNSNSAKYRYVAKAREDVKVLLPEYIHALQKVWMEGEDPKLEELEKQWRLPTFHGLKICLTGFENPEQRKYIQESVINNGAQYHGDLTKAVTHLIAAKPSGSKYEHAINWRIKTVTWEWFEQSLERGMALDETLYHPTMAVADRGVGAWIKRKSTSPMLGKRMRPAEQPKSVLNPLRRKLRRSASTRLSGQTEALWAGITAGGPEKNAGREDDWTEVNVAQQEPSPAVEHTTTAAELPVDVAPQKGFSTRARGPFSDEHDGIFEGRVVFLHGFDKNKTRILREHLDSNGAEVVCDAEALCDLAADELGRGFLLVPHDVQLDLTSLPEAAGGMTLVTNWWVERCLHGKCLVHPTDYVLSTPFNKLSISGFKGLTINSTGFAGIELLHVTKAVVLFGAEYDEVLSPKISVLVCCNHKPNAEKLKYATEKGIPVVHAKWFWECVRQGEVQPYDEHLLVPSQEPNRMRRGSSKMVPTAPLTKEESFRLQQKQIRKSKPDGNVQNESRRPGILELSASGPPTPSTTGSTTHPNTTNEESNLAFGEAAQIPDAYDGAAEILPLQEVDPGVNSLRRPSASSNDPTERPNTKLGLPRKGPRDPPLKVAPVQRASRHFRQSSPDSVTPLDAALSADTSGEATANQSVPPVPEKDYSDIMSKLLASRKTSAPAEKEEDKGRRRRRPLGRAQSSRSNTSNAADDALSRTSSAAKLMEEEEMGEDDDNVLQAFKPPEPSQQLGWDSPGAQRAREKMIRAIGGNVTAESPLIEETRMVRDAVIENGLGMGRASRSRRG